ncbi:MAG: 50S ribosomal protein L14e, partial [Nanoarchaeota archaeon]|nr:50S ribosomal protein L14e [Nanoarchaeota archaeon]
MFEIGRLCVKIAGRDARGKCLVIDTLEGNFVLIDGQTRRKRCNITHLEPLDKVLKIKKGASHE